MFLHGRPCAAKFGSVLRPLCPALLLLLAASSPAQQGPATRREERGFREADAKSYRNDPALSRSLELPLKLSAGPAVLIVRHEPRHELAARYVGRMSQAYLPAVERLLERPLRLPSRKIIIHGRGESIHSPEDVNVSLEGALESPALLFHELGHLWFGLAGGSVEWFDQGVVSYLAIALHEHGLLRLSPQELRNVRSAWSWAQTDWADDFALREFAPGRKSSRVLYDKSFKVQYLLHRELGRAGYARLLRDILQAKRRLSETELFTFLDRGKARDWKQFLSGWVLTGPYHTFSPTSFADRDEDRLIDVEEHYLRTDPARADSDGDGYADGWEVASGHDPLQAKSPGPLPRPVVDGVTDLHLPPPEQEVLDARGEATASTDIDSGAIHLSPESGQRTVFVRAQFRAREKGPALHTLHLRSPDGRNFWIQANTIDMLNVWISEFRDGEPFERWRKSNVPGGRVKLALADVFEARFAPADFGIHGDFQLSYMAGGRTAGREVWNSDDFGPIWLYAKRTAPHIDGVGDDLLSLPLRLLKDPAGDVQADRDIFDLALLGAHADRDNLYVLGRFHQPIRDNVPGFITIHVRLPSERRNFWVQFRGSSQVALASFTDGTPFEKWTALPRAEWAGIRVGLGPDFEAKIPLALLGTRSPASMEVSLKLGARRGGSEVWNAEEAGPLLCTPTR